ncbi:Homeobox domain-like [Propionibacterium ruminifibrarum]|uniref:Homeobox domain-like n=1 Tax=Propionibacterium ruminifibrarum TaxID=1962131 RepID=A0A375I0N1_9ACTN|nr:Homeobox domain-like [Propionibacterium ruminifibrarum]
MSAPKYGADFKEQVVLEVVQQSKPIAGVARSYGLVAQTVRVLGCEVAENTPAPVQMAPPEEHAEVKRLKAELREARMEAEHLEESGGPRSPQEPRVSSEYCPRSSRPARPAGKGPARPPLPVRDGDGWAESRTFRPGRDSPTWRWSWSASPVRSSARDCRSHAHRARHRSPGHGRVGPAHRPVGSRSPRSDRGVKYASACYTEFMTNHGILPSVGRDR